MEGNPLKLRPRDIFNVALFSALTAIGAYIYVPLPFSPVPITMQTLFTYMSGVLLGAYLGALSQLIYVLIGISGMPIFAGGNAGFWTLIGPTGGYLVGFIVGAFVIGKLVEVKRNPSPLWMLGCLTVGTLLIYIFGIIQLMNWMKIDLNEAIVIGVSPFIPGDLLKMSIATCITHRIRRMLPRLTQPYR